MAVVCGVSRCCSLLKHVCMNVFRTVSDCGWDFWYVVLPGWNPDEAFLFSGSVYSISRSIIDLFLYVCLAVFSLIFVCLFIVWLTCVSPNFIVINSTSGNMNTSV